MTDTTKREAKPGVEKRTVKPTMRQAEFEAQFDTEDKCLAALIAKRWPEGVRCPRCQSEKVTNPKPFRWQCRQCNKNGYRFSPLVGTIFENTNVPLTVWFKVMFLMSHSKKGISALQIYRMIGGKTPVKKGSYRTAWYMCQRIRSAMKSDEFIRLTGVVEVDETYIGGKDRNRHKGKKSADMRASAEPKLYSARGEAVGYGKVGVIGAIARKGNVIAQVIGQTDTKTLAGFVDKVIADNDKVKLLATDSAHEYRYVRQGLNHEAVNHGAGEYVRGNVHTNSIESFWSLLKRGVLGTYHNVSKEYLPLYLNEFSFRYNNRNSADIFERILASA